MRPVVTPYVYPAYARSERIADGTVHLLGVLLAVTGTVLLLVFAALWAQGGPGQMAALAVYGGAITLSLIASACYHMTPWERFRAPLRRLDHAAIYLKIAGTYTPLVVLVGGVFSYVVLAAVWVAAIGGAVAKLAFFRSPGWVGTALYLGLGWASLLLAWPLVTNLPPAASVLVLTGGLIYSLGVVFFRWESLKFSNAIWHGFVLAGSGCFYAAITLGTFA
jgi:hemolysin III